jgi:MarR family 2-MHQ and catechol resistance regulon transcriptional repressor
MEALLQRGSLTINQIGKKVLLTSGSMTAAINRLEKSGLVKRLRNQSDGRYFYVHLTKNGCKVIREAYHNHRLNLEKIAEILTDEEKMELIRLLKKMGLHADRLVIS